MRRADIAGNRRRALALAAGLALLCGGRAAAQDRATLFPAPFVVEHHVVQSEPDGTTSATEPVTDYYGGSSLVSVRPTGSRLVVDFSRRELTEIRPEASTYAILSFDRFAELRARLRATRAPAPDAGGETVVGASGVHGTAAGARASIVVEDIGSQDAVGMTVGATAANAGVVRLRVTAEDGSPAIEVWCDRRVRLTEAARAALAALEEEVLGGGAAKGAGAGAMLAAARARAGGAFPVRTLRRAASAEGSATIEDVATRLEPLASFPDELLRVPDGYRRVSHPLEVMVAYEEQEAALARGERPGR
jgi:hypothetical protein